MMTFSSYHRHTRWLNHFYLSSFAVLSVITLAFLIYTTSTIAQSANHSPVMVSNSADEMQPYNVSYRMEASVAHKYSNPNF